MELSEKVKGLPLTPGVYLMKDSLGNIIYVGKAKALKRRVQSYFQSSRNHPAKVKMMVRSIRDLDYILTDTEFEAFMLECRLIKELKPVYNRKMKNPRSYSYIVIRMDEPCRIEITYEVPGKEEPFVFGPYPGKGVVEDAVRGLQESLSILCTTPYGRSGPCLNHSLGLCLGMCMDQEAAERHRVILGRIAALLEGTDMGVLDEMDERMQEAAGRFDFEAAAKYRDYMNAVRFLVHKEKVIGFAEENRNIAVLEPVHERLYKLILIKGNRVLLAEKVILGHHDARETCAGIKEMCLGSFGSAAASDADSISRYNIDEAQIIYSYLQNSSTRYVVIEEEWLAPEGGSLLEETLHSLLAMREST